MAKNIIKAGIIGCGAIFPFYYLAIKNSEHIQLKCICDINPLHIKGIQFERNYEKLLDQDLDLVIIATPPHLHYIIANFFLKNQLNVIIEKPAVITKRELELLKNNKNKDKLFLAYHSRFNPLVIKLKELLGDEQINSIKATCLENLFKFHPNSKQWITKKKLAGGGCIIDSAINALAVISLFVENIDITSCSVDSYIGEVESSSNIKIDFDFGKGIIKNNWNYSGKRVEQICFKTKKDTYVLDYVSMQLTKNSQTIFQMNSDKKSSDMHHEYKNLINYIGYNMDNNQRQNNEFCPLELVFNCYKLIGED